VYCVDGRPVRRNYDTRYGCSALLCALELHVLALRNGAVVPTLKGVNIRRSVVLPSRDQNSFSARRPRKAAPGSLERERGYFLFCGQIDHVQLMAGVSRIGECEHLAIRADLRAQYHVAGFQLTSGRSDPPAIRQ